MEIEKLYLNLGCGDDVREGWQNCDLPANPKADIHLDLEDAKLPFEDNSVALVTAFHVLEHVRNFIPLMNEIYRVLQPNGILHMKLPEFPCAASVADPTHVRYFTPETFTLIHNPLAGYDTSGLRGKFEIRFMESLPHDRPGADRKGVGSFFTELEVELQAIKIGQMNEKGTDISEQ